MDEFHNNICRINLLLVFGLSRAEIDLVHIAQS
jgi:hypothetical protein